MVRRTSHAASELSMLMLSSPFVIADRMTEFWMTAASPSAKAKRERVEMVTEKMEAAGESMVAMNMAMTRLAIDGATSMMSGRHRSMENDIDDVLSAGLKPYTKRVRANRRRLAK